MMLCDVWMDEDEPQTVTGVVMVEDIKDFSLSHFAALSPVAIKKMMTLFQVFLPPRLHLSKVQPQHLRSL